MWCSKCQALCRCFMPHGLTRQLQTIAHVEDLSSFYCVILVAYVSQSRLMYGHPAPDGECSPTLNLHVSDIEHFASGYTQLRQRCISRAAGGLRERARSGVSPRSSHRGNQCLASLPSSHLHLSTTDLYHVHHTENSYYIPATRIAPWLRVPGPGV